MAGSVNKVILIGNVGRDPESRTTQSGQKVVSFSLATAERWTDKNSGERKERTTWHRIVVWNEGIAGVIEKYVKKGDPLYVEGSLDTRKYTDKDGVEREITEVVLKAYRGEVTLLASRGDGGGGGDRGASSGGSSDGYGAGTRAASGAGARQPARGRDDLDEDIPF